MKVASQILLLLFLLPLRVTAVVVTASEVAAPAGWGFETPGGGDLWYVTPGSTADRHTEQNGLISPPHHWNPLNGSYLGVFELDGASYVSSPGTTFFLQSPQFEITSNKNVVIGLTYDVANFTTPGGPAPRVRVELVSTEVMDSYLIYDSGALFGQVHFPGAINSSQQAAWQERGVGSKFGTPITPANYIFQVTVAFPNTSDSLGFMVVLDEISYATNQTDYDFMLGDVFPVPEAGSLEMSVVFAGLSFLASYFRKKKEA